MTKYIVAFALLALIVLLAGLAVRGWGRRRNEQEQLLQMPAESIPHFAAELEVDGFYVATTKAGEPLNRINAYGLGPRGKASIAISAQGVVIRRGGEVSFAIPSSDLVAVQLVSGAIDRAVETGGLIAMTWLNGGEMLETTIRVVDESQRSLMVAALANFAREGSN